MNRRASDWSPFYESKEKLVLQLVLETHYIVYTYTYKKSIYIYKMVVRCTVEFLDYPTLRSLRNAIFHAGPLGDRVIAAKSGIKCERSLLFFFFFSNGSSKA